MNPLTPWVGYLFQAGTLLYLLAALSARPRLTRLCLGTLGAAMVANLASMGLKLYLSWPMQSPFQEPFWLPVAVAGLALGSFAKGRPSLGRGLVVVTATLALIAALFPKDFYLPFPRSNTIVAHIFLPMSAIGKACFYAAGTAAVMYLSHWKETTELDRGRPLFGRLIVWGFVIFTLSLFLAEIWSYLGWASPVIWNNATMTSTMAVWFYYGCFLHLYLLRAWSARRRAWFAVAGVPLLIVFTLLPETGGFQWPEWWL
ncbi:MAG: cytochrome c biogenesis protein [Deltaproteobacteria bacterium]|nr:cytochrome c biogenesis protein [Deltaproteobacteria bacterium]